MFAEKMQMEYLVEARKLLEKRDSLVSIKELYNSIEERMNLAEKYGIYSEYRRTRKDLAIYKGLVSGYSRSGRL
jgi:hypothetical protein